MEAKKIEVGMYARYKNYRDIDTIAKITDVRLSDEYVSENYYRFDTEDGAIESRIVKASHDILDLIEVGDYVNGLEVISTGETYPDATYTNKFKYLLTTSYKGVIKNEDIKSVVTKEQFSQMEYKIGG